MNQYLLDTNHLGAAIRRISPLRDRLRQAYRRGVRFHTCWPVLCELEDGIIETADQAYEVEFVTGAGQTLAVETLQADALRPLGAGEILHSRGVTAA